MTYPRTGIRTIENYQDRNHRLKSVRKGRPAAPFPFPFLDMTSGQFFDITCPSSKAASLRTTLHQTAKRAGIWVHVHKLRQNASETTLRVIHDGERK